MNFFDTAQAYGFGASERLLGTSLRSELTRHRDQLVITTKGGLRRTERGMVRDVSPRWLRGGFEASLRALGVEHLDLYQVHWPDPTIPAAATAGALAELVAEGRIVHVGVSNYDTVQLAQFAATLTVETLQPPYHLFRRNIEDQVLPYCRAHDIGVLVYGPLAHGLLTATVTEHTRFASGDWRASSATFTGDGFGHNLAAAAVLEKFAADRGLYRQPAGHRLDPGQPRRARGHPRRARRAGHVEDSLAAAAALSADDLAEIDAIMVAAAPTIGPSRCVCVMTAGSDVAVPRVAVLGTGTMGAPMARNLLRAGLPVRVWNRSPAKAQALAADGAVVATEPAAAVAGVGVVITMLTDSAAVEQVMTGPGGALSALRPGAVWVQMSTVGVDWADRLAGLAARHGVAFLDAPVSGSSQPAIAGGPLASPYATAKANAMLDTDFAPGFPLQHAAKDAALAADAAHDHRAELALTAALLRRWQRGIELGHGADDVAAGITVPADTASKSRGRKRRRAEHGTSTSTSKER